MEDDQEIINSDIFNWKTDLALVMSGPKLMTVCTEFDFAVFLYFEAHS